MKKNTFQFLLFIFSIVNLSCSQSIKIAPTFDPEAIILPRSGTVAYNKHGITVAAIPLNEIDSTDAFAVFIFNGTNSQISFKRGDCWLIDGTGTQGKILSRSEQRMVLGEKFEPKLPTEFSAEASQNRLMRKLSNLPISTVDSDETKTIIMPGDGTQFFIYFKTRSTNSSRLRMTLPKVVNENDRTETTFVFKFLVQSS